MGFFKRLKKVVKGVAKIAVKTAPVWTNFIPGGSAVGKVVSRVAPLLDKAKQMKSRLPPRMRALVSKGVAISRQQGFGSPMGMAGPALRGTAAMSMDEEAAFDMQGVQHAGIRGPVASHWGPKWKGPAHGVTTASFGRLTGLTGGMARRPRRRRAPLRRRARRARAVRRRSPLRRRVSMRRRRRAA